ncbi:MAG: hypothetical protein GWM92_17120 [Gemmatimonadetes bacterium]|nr:hypothetical protein [Gemmatimonadota bacterium]NIR80492.1 hypothetical protein [Gemmatimonadota bacterium]NIT89253.1 hypothetical protein [Gemmatimonadota bacterium]NIU33052.1 hypothetical protein [Gemmatimonadota bacterium]NIU37433.1 hypothetical protein [Gemmatimonadota bacterium]
MGRRIRDENFQEWEAFATTGDFGFPRPARIVFRCRTDPETRPRHVVIDGDKSDAEARLTELGEAELEELLQEAETLG